MWDKIKDWLSDLAEEVEEIFSPDQEPELVPIPVPVEDERKRRHPRYNK